MARKKQNVGHPTPVHVTLPRKGRKITPQDDVAAGKLSKSCWPGIDAETKKDALPRKLRHKRNLLVRKVDQRSRMVAVGRDTENEQIKGKENSSRREGIDFAVLEGATLGVGVDP
jgi:hypothetical protein